MQFEMKSGEWLSVCREAFESELCSQCLRRMWLLARMVTNVVDRPQLACMQINNVQLSGADVGWRIFLYETDQEEKLEQSKGAVLENEAFRVWLTSPSGESKRSRFPV